jgi:hypothetical protein
LPQEMDRMSQMGKCDHIEIIIRHIHTITTIISSISVDMAPIEKRNPQGIRGFLFKLFY